MEFFDKYSIAVQEKRRDGSIIKRIIYPDGKPKEKKSFNQNGSQILRENTYLSLLETLPIFEPNRIIFTKIRSASNANNPTGRASQSQDKGKKIRKSWQKHIAA